MTNSLWRKRQEPDQYAKGYADAMNWKVQNHLEHLPAAQPEQEPVAWISPKELLVMRGNAYAGAKDWRVNLGLEPEEGDVGLYTTPPQRKPLTDDEIWKFWWARPEVSEGEDDSMEAEFVAAVRRVLAAHGIKE